MRLVIRGTLISLTAMLLLISYGCSPPIRVVEGPPLELCPEPPLVQVHKVDPSISDDEFIEVLMNVLVNKTEEAHDLRSTVLCYTKQIEGQHHGR